MSRTQKSTAERWHSVKAKDRPKLDLQSAKGTIDCSPIRSIWFLGQVRAMRLVFHCENASLPSLQIACRVVDQDGDGVRRGRRWCLRATIDGKCGYGFIRASEGGAPPANLDMAR